MYIAGPLRMVAPPRPGGMGLPCHGTGSNAYFSLRFLYTLYKPGMGKLVQRKSQLQKTKNTSEPQSQFVVLAQIRQRMQVLHKMMYSNCHYSKFLFDFVVPENLNNTML